MGPPHSGPGGVRIGALLLLGVLGLVSGLSLEPVYWNSANKRFQAEGGYVLYPQIGDRLDLLCPRARPPGPHSSPNYEFYKLYLVGGAQGRRCEAPPAPNLLLTCDRPDLDLRFTIKFQEYSPNLWGHEFRSHHDYYIIATSDGTREGLESLQGGVCLTRGMKVLLRVGQSPQGGAAPRKPVSEIPMERDRGAAHSLEPGKENAPGDPTSNATSRGAEGPLPPPSMPAVAGAAGGLALLLLGVAGAGGAMCWRRRRAKPSESRHPGPGSFGRGGSLGLGGGGGMGPREAEPGELGIALRGGGASDPPFCPHYEKVSGDYGHPVYIVQDGPPQSPPNIYYKVCSSLASSSPHLLSPSWLLILCLSQLPGGGIKALLPLAFSPLPTSHTNHSPQSAKNGGLMGKTLALHPSSGHGSRAPFSALAQAFTYLLQPFGVVGS
ncbi:Ephrin-B3 [Plecturocebus cupreus]